MTGGEPTPYLNYVAAGHVEGKAAIQIRQMGSTGGTIHHNNPNGICVYCHHTVPTLLPVGATLTVVPPPQAKAPSPRWHAEPTTYVGIPDEAERPDVSLPFVTPHGIEVFHLSGHDTVASNDQSLSVLRERVSGGNHFEIAPATTTYPLLTLMVRDDFAVLHHFSSEHDVGSQSSGNLHGVPPAVGFPDPGGEDVTLPGSIVIDVVTAERCVQEFAEHLIRPTIVDWLEL